jgi:hypothetical protein
MLSLSQDILRSVMELEVSLAYSQKPITGLYPNSDISNPNLSKLFP